jgi:tryptophan-rich sensory protein
MIALGFSIVLNYAISPEINTWFIKLNRPGFLPPKWLMVSVWIILCILISISSWIIYEINGYTFLSLTLCPLQLILIFLWNSLFFDFHFIFLAWIEMSLLIIFIILNIRYFYTKSKISAYLLLPYLVWMIFFWTLGISLIYMN